MKLILFAIFNIIALSSISSRNLRPSDIFKGNNYGKNFNHVNKTKPINSKNDYILKDQKDLEKSYDSKYQNDTKEITISSTNIKDTIKGPPTNIKEKRYPNGNIKKGTGFEKISYHKDLGLKDGGCFMACCVIGGLTSNEQILKAREWSLKNKYITDDNSVKIPYKDFAKKISEQYQTTYNSNWEINGLRYNKIYWVIDSTKKEIFNSAGLKTRQYRNYNK